MEDFPKRQARSPPGWRGRTNASANSVGATGTPGRFAAGYAELRRELIPHARQMPALGAPGHRPAAMPGHLAALLHDPAVVIAEQKRETLRASQAGYAAAGPADLAEYGDRVGGWAEELLDPRPGGQAAARVSPGWPSICRAICNLPAYAWQSQQSILTAAHHAQITRP